MDSVLSAFTDEAGPSCAQQITAAQRAGLNFIDIRSMDGHNISVLPVEQAQRIRAQLDAAGLGVNMFGSPLGKIDLADDFSAEVLKLQHLGKLAPVLGCNAIRIFSYYNKMARLSHADFQKQALARLQELAKIATDLGLILYHENEAEIFGDKAHDVLTIIHEVRSAWGAGRGVFRTIFDFGNFNAGREEVWHCWEMLRDFTDGIHIKDNVWATDQTLHHVVAGEGQGRIEKILRDAVARGFAGPVSIEPHVSHSPAVLATGPSGMANQAFATMRLEDSFHLAAVGAKQLCRRVGMNLI